MLRSALTACSIALVMLLSESQQASATSAVRQYQLQTRMFPQAPSVGEFDGSLKLDVSQDGIVSGYYRALDDPRFVPVTGGISGDRFWLDIASFSAEPLRFSGTFRNGRIDAAANQPYDDDGRYTALRLVGTPLSH